MEHLNIVIYHGTSAEDEFLYPKTIRTPFVWFTDSFEAAQRYARLRYMENGGVPRVLKYLVNNDIRHLVRAVDNILEYAQTVFGDDYTVSSGGKHSVVYRVRRSGCAAQPWIHFDYLVQMGYRGLTERGVDGSTDWVFIAGKNAENAIHNHVMYLETIYV